MNMKKYYSLRDLSVELDIPKSTIVKYKDLFPEFFTLTGEGKRKKFIGDAVEVLATIRRLREEEKLDWLDIRDVLEERFAAPAGDPAPNSPGMALAPAAAYPQAAAPAALNSRLDHLAHLFNAVTLEVLRIGDETRTLQKQQRVQAEQFVKVAAGFNRLRHDVELVLIEAMNRDEANRQLIDGRMNDIKLQFAAVQRSIKALAVMIKNSQNGGSSDASAISALSDKIDRMSATMAAQKPAQQAASVDSAKLQQLQRENEMLKEKVRQLGTMQRTQSAGQHEAASKKSGGMLSKMFKSKP